MHLLPPIFAKDFDSDAWRRIKARVEGRIEQLRDDLEARTNTEGSTEATRGRIAALRELLALEKAPATEPRAGDRYGRQLPVEPKPRATADT